MQSGRISRYTSSALEYAIVFIAWLIVAAPFLTNGRWTYGFDLVAYTGPSTRLTFDAWKGGHLPLWDPFSFGGVPFLGRLGAGGMYFPNLPFVLFDVHSALHYSTALHLFVLALGFLILIRHGLRLTAPSGAIAATVILGSSFVAANVLSFDRLVALAWVPWILFFIERILQNVSPRRYVFALTVSSSALVLGGHPQFVFIFVLFIAGYGTVRIVETKKWKNARYILFAGIFTIGVTALQLVAYYFLNKSSPMAGPKSLESLREPAYTLAPSRLWIGLSGDTFNSNPIAVTGSSEAVAGIGVVGSLLSLYAVASWRLRRKQALVPFLLVIICLSLTLSVGARWFPYRLAYEFIPGLASGRVPGRFLVLVVISGALLTAYGVHQLMQRVNEFRNLFIFCSFYVLLSVLITVVSFVKPSRTLTLWAIGIALLLVGMQLLGSRVIFLPLILLLIGVVLIETVIRQKNHRENQIVLDSPSESFTTPITRFLSHATGRSISLTRDDFSDYQYLIESLRPNVHTFHGVKSIDGYDGGQWIQERWVQSMESLTSTDFNTYLTLRSQIRFPINADKAGRYGIRWAVVDESMIDAAKSLQGWTRTALGWKTLRLWENPTAISTGRLYFQTALHDTGESYLNLETPSVATVEDSSAVFSCVMKDCSYEPVNAITDEGDKVSFRIDSKKKSILVVNQSWSPDWRVYVNNKLTHTLPVDGSMLGVVLEPGQSTVIMEFRPVWYEPLFVISLISFLLSLMYSFIFGNFNYIQKPRHFLNKQSDRVQVHRC